MSSKLDESDFVDRDLEATQESGAPSPGADDSSADAPPSREELTSRVTETQQKLAELKRMQEEIERESNELQEARKRRIELTTGREEMVQHLTRGIGLLEEAELSSGRTAEQLAMTVSDLQGSLDKVTGIEEGEWTEENWSVELTRALTTIENARMEWNSARLKWPVLDGETDLRSAAGQPQVIERPGLEQHSFWQLSRLGLAFTWPLVVVGIAVVILLILLRS
ncbi:MAG TPA: hypothetical protein EYM30_03560 [Verrucomicrobia bacterium]|nr:hypothetical protein [Verrucomicrobiota bacterium]|tara:strand:+ start:1099 stop:1770 length:672 start_codon:yes stop_codon:yes gene_type:complete